MSHLHIITWYLTSCMFSLVPSFMDGIRHVMRSTWPVFVTGIFMPQALTCAVIVTLSLTYARHKGSMIEHHCRGKQPEVMDIHWPGSHLLKLEHHASGDDAAAPEWVTYQFLTAQCTPFVGCLTSRSLLKDWPKTWRKNL
jgi:hypothetical protein